MSDVVVTVPKRLWAEWLSEGDLAYDDDSGMEPGWCGDYEYGFHMRGPRPDCVPGDRVYIVAHGHLRGYAPLVKIDGGQRFGGGRNSFALVRRGSAIAVTLPAAVPSLPRPIRGFQGYRYRWWAREEEIPFPAWRTAGVE